jgi:hypothetical protein
MATWIVTIRTLESGYLVHQLAAIFDSRRAASYAAVLKQAELDRRRFPFEARVEPARKAERGEKA